MVGKNKVVVRKNKEMYQEDTWDLSALKTGDLDSELAAIGKKVKNLEAQRKLLTNTITPKVFLTILREFEMLRKHIEMFASFYHLKQCEDVSNQTMLAASSKIESTLTQAGNRLLFFSFWFKDLPDAKAQELIKASGKYHYYLETIRKTKKYTLSEKEEKIINLKDVTGSSALNTLYELTTSHFEYILDGKKYTQEELVTFVRSGSATVREKTYRTLLSPYQKHADVIGEIYKNIIMDWRQEHITLRGYKSAISVRNVDNDLPDKAVEALLHVCQKNENVFHRFFEIKRKRLGLKQLRRYDIYAPLAEEKATISYDEAIRIVLETFDSFSSQFGNAARKIIDGKHIHSSIGPKKRSGAFCSTVTTDIAPYVFLTYTGKYRDVSTLAHELGHGVHSVLSAGQTEFTHSSCLPLAETASVFSEMLLAQKVRTKNPALAKQMIFTHLDDIYATIIRQAGFVRFEIVAHEMIKQGKTVDEISAKYLEMLRKQVGSNVVVDDLFAHEWLYIPHIFHTPFYCYAYAFGNLLTLALYEMYQEQGEKMVNKIITMLAAGGSESPVKVTKALGVDICSEKFWQKGFDSISKMIDEIE
ncbi:M3 family oligoendopeptidase [Candidatus Woesearchaeota archaeon]|nr:M3 family oligoendopeptidase [Candidatus Woesearchaeota archaeon]